MDLRPPGSPSDGQAGGTATPAPADEAGAGALAAAPAGAAAGETGAAPAASADTGSADAAAASPSGGGPPAGRKGPGKRERILRAATELFAEKDYHKVLTDEVAHRAGVGKGTVYRYFESKQALFVAVLSYAVDFTAERLRAKLERVDDPVEQLRVATKQALVFFRENDHLFHVLHHEKSLRSAPGAPELNEKRQALRHFAEHILVDGKRQGAFEIEDTGFASTILWGMIRTALRTQPRELPLEELAGRIVDLFARGALARGAPARQAHGRNDP